MTKEHSINKKEKLKEWIFMFCKFQISKILKYFNKITILIKIKLIKIEQHPQYSV